MPALSGRNAAGWLEYPTALRQPCGAHWMRRKRLDVLILIAPTAIRPANGAIDSGSAALESRLHEVQCPTLVVFGQDDATVAPEATSIYRERIPNCSIAFVYDAGHDVAAERPEALVNLVSDYLERRETFIVQNRSRVINP